MTNLHCCHCLGGGGLVAFFLSFLLVYNQALAAQYSVFNKTQIKYLKLIITIKLLEKADFLG